MVITEKEVLDYKDKGGLNEIYALNLANTKAVYKDKPIFKLFSSSWFLTLAKDEECPSREGVGIVVCVGFSIFISFLLLLFLW